MQFVKTLLIVAVLAVVTYGVYAALTGKSDTAPPPGAPPIEQATGAPQIELPNFDAQAPSGIPGVGGLPGAAPAAAAPAAPPSTLGEAPRYTTPTPAADNTGAAPPFDTPGVGPGQAPPAAGAPPAYDPGVAPPAAALPAAPPATSFDPAAGLPPAADVAPPAAAPDPSAPPGGAPPPAAPAANYQTDCITAHGLLQQRQLDQALVLMSRWYGDATLSEQDQTALLGLLNQLAGTVIYSREHLITAAYEVQPGDTLDAVARRYRVPPELLAKINSVADPNRLQPGEKLKVVTGPFDAHVDMRNRYLTLWLQGRFAGRFPIAVGAEHAAADGEYAVKAKTPNPPYYGRERTIPPDDPANPLGKYWIDLGQQIAIHGTNDPESLKRDDQRGCVRMHPRDIEDVYDMVTTESRVTIKR